MTTLDPQFKAEVDYVMQYGGRCRDCADNFGTCPMTNLPCGPDEARDAIQRILKAIDYGREHGYLPAALPAQPVAVRPLPWTSNGRADGSIWAHVEQIDRYWAIEPESNVFRLETRIMPSEYSGDDMGLYPTLDVAKAAAQADYEQRIRSALAAPSQQEGVTDWRTVFDFVIKLRDEWQGPYRTAADMIADQIANDHPEVDFYAS